MECAASEDGAPINCIDGGSCSFNVEPSSISYCSVAIVETVIRLEGVLIR